MLELLDLMLQLLFLLQHLLNSLLQLMLLILRGCLLSQDVLLKNLELGHVMLEGSQLMLVLNSILLQDGQGLLVLLLEIGRAHV